MTRGSILTRLPNSLGEGSDIQGSLIRVLYCACWEQRSREDLSYCKWKSHKEACYRENRGAREARTSRLLSLRCYLCHAISGFGRHLGLYGWLVSVA